MKIIMDNLAAQNDELCIENSEPIIIINKKLCKIINNENNLEENDAQILVEKFHRNTITSLDLSNCQLLDFPLNFCTLDYITELNISGNKLQQLPDEFINMKKLRILNISNNFFQEIPIALDSGLHLIKFLNVSNNKITCMYKPPCCLAKLQHLDLSCNLLLEPPSWLLDDAPSSLEYLDLSNNPCFQEYYGNKNSCSENKVAGRIKTLKISNCKFREAFCSYLLNFSSLNILEFGNNDIKPNYINYITYLKCMLPSSMEKLSMVNIGLGGISSSITDLSNLRYLNISDNNIHWLPPSIKNLSSLTVLHAKSCNLCLIPCEMNELVSLKELYLSSNQLASTEGFENLVNLEVLDLYSNQFICLPNLHKFSKMNSLDLCQNYVEPPSIIKINGLKYDYANLKANLRSKIKNCNRIDGEKEFTTAPEDDLSDDFIETSEEEFCDAEPEDTEYTLQNENGLDQCQDCWDQDENETFDPNVWTMKDTINITRKESCESLTGEIPYEVTTHPHYFTPYQLVTPIAVSKATLPPPVEGQFDD
ncbi:leucine-rich repeat protein lrrA isoform X2 [Halyomorpha halys]|uniref:leucine-rich repeat protein lrrA isoform X2 n=1 Tax=Halyomorpha halys TaxID=286706 RepID=UPI0006D4FB25|nr:leucine-rich repeat protein SHOC-2-like isoform X2 [Halyomorpha halys]